MAYNSTSESSYLILDSLADGSKYGLEIIEHIFKRTNGSYIMKKPTLYSCLTRMEKKGLVSSSYWGESDMGGKRHYYTITAEGKREYAQLSLDFQNASFDNDETNEEPVQKDDAVFIEERVSSPTVMQQDNIFNLVNDKTESSSTKEKTVKETEPNIVENQMDIFSIPLQPEQSSQDNTSKEKDAIQEQTTSQYTTNVLSNTSSVESSQDKMAYYQTILEGEQKHDDAVLLSENERLTPKEESENKRIFDTSSELKKFRKRKSFAENQIEMNVVYETEEEQEIQKARIQELKASLLSARNKGFSTQENPPKENVFYSENSPKPTFASDNIQNSRISQEPIISQEEPNDDAVFITSRYDEVPVQKKITPPDIEISVTTENLPAPKRNSNLEPTYKDMMSKLFERKKEKEQEKQNSTKKQAISQTQAQSTQTLPQTETNLQVENFADYNSLRKYYNGHGIEFKEYQSSKVEMNHNTNFLVFISSIVLLLLSGIGVSIVYGIGYSTKFLNVSTNFMFYTLPILFFVYTIFTLIRYKFCTSKKAVFMYNSVVSWAIFVLSVVVVVVINILCGMQYENMLPYVTSLIIPIYAMLLCFPVNYYIKKFLYRHYSK